jgi:hypothetical protein
MEEWGWRTPQLRDTIEPDPQFRTLTRLPGPILRSLPGPQKRGTAGTRGVVFWGRDRDGYCWRILCALLSMTEER